MNKTRKRFILYAILALFVLLAVLVSVINVINFTAVSRDADRVTEMIADGRGTFARENPGFNKDEKREDSVPDSPELPYSARYFTFRFNRGGNIEEVAFNIVSYSKEEAADLARSLIGNSVGWTGTYYRYRVYTSGDFTYVTVLDQTRELRLSFRVLNISILGMLIVLCVCFACLIFISRKLFAPLEEAERKQEKFISEAESRLKVPLTVINSGVDIIEKTNGVNEYTQAIRRSASSMTAFTKQLADLSLADDGAAKKEKCDISVLFNRAVGIYSPRLAEKGVSVSADIEDKVIITGNRGTLERMAEELMENVYKFALKECRVSLKNDEGHITITVSNDAELKETDGGLDRVFDRFTRLSNANSKPGNGLGLSFVKDAVKSHNGRLKAEAADGIFTIRIVI